MEDDAVERVECWLCFTQGLTCFTRNREAVCQDCFNHRYKTYTDCRPTISINDLVRIYRHFDTKDYKWTCHLCQTIQSCYINVPIHAGLITISQTAHAT